jgi:hypothetical protein
VWGRYAGATAVRGSLMASSAVLYNFFVNRFIAGFMVGAFR